MISSARRKITLSFALAIGAVMLWGFGTYAYDWYLDATSPPISERAFLHGRIVVIEAFAISVLLAICWAICYALTSDRRRTKLLQ
jgi:4-hydroxybenzoate polyprenyltransferase